MDRQLSCRASDHAGNSTHGRVGKLRNRNVDIDGREFLVSQRRI